MKRDLLIDPGVPARVFNYMGLSLWWAWSSIAFFNTTIYNADALAALAPRYIWVSSCAGMVLTLLVMIGLSDKVKTISTCRPLLILSPVMTGIGGLMFFLAYRQGLICPMILALTGGFITGVGTAWLTLAWGEMFSFLGMRMASKIVPFSLLIGTILGIAISQSSLPVAVASLLCIPALSMFLFWMGIKVQPIDSKNLAQVPAPHALPARLMVNIGAVGITLGYPIGLGVPAAGEGVPPIASPLGVIVISAILVLWTAILHRELDIRLLYRVTLLVLIAALLVFPFLGEPWLDIDLACKSACYSCFDIAIWIIMANIVALTRASPLRIFGYGRLLTHLGMIVGFSLGFLTGVWMVHMPSLYYLMPLGIAFSLVVCAFAALGEANIFTIPPAENEQSAPVRSDIGNLVTSPGLHAADSGSELCDVPMSDANDVALSDSFDAACVLVAREYRLTNREREVLQLLARGRNAFYIAEALVISENTAKAHFKHIYSKLGINNQQQLIDIVSKYIEAGR